MNARLTVSIFLLIILIGLPVGLLHAQTNYSPILFDDDSASVGDSVTVVVMHPSLFAANNVTLNDTLVQSDVQTRQAKLERNNTETQFANEQLTKDTGKPLTGTMSLIESLTQTVVQSNYDEFLVVLVITVGAIIAFIVSVTVALSRRKPQKQLKNIPRA